MNPLTRLVDWLRPTPRTPEEVAAKQEADRLRAEMKTTRSAPGSVAGENYESQGRRR